MSNMSYCRFQNTAGDLQDCVDNFEDDDLGRDEASARQRLWNLAQQLIDDYPDGPPEAQEDEDNE